MNYYCDICERNIHFKYGESITLHVVGHFSNSQEIDNQIKSDKRKIYLHYNQRN